MQVIRVNKPLARRALNQATDQRPRVLIPNPSLVPPWLTVGEWVLLIRTRANVCAVVFLRMIVPGVPCACLLLQEETSTSPLHVALRDTKL